jgi:hypothetical protein
MYQSVQETLADLAEVAVGLDQVLLLEEAEQRFREHLVVLEVLSPR